MLAFDVDLVALLAVLLDDVGQACEPLLFHRMTRCHSVFSCLSPALALPLPAGGEGEGRDPGPVGGAADLGVRAEVADQDDFVQAAAHRNLHISGVTGQGTADPGTIEAVGPLTNQIYTGGRTFTQRWERQGSTRASSAGFGNSAAGHRRGNPSPYKPGLRRWIPGPPGRPRVHREVGVRGVRPRAGPARSPGGDGRGSPQDSALPPRRPRAGQKIALHVVPGRGHQPKQIGRQHLAKSLGAPRIAEAATLEDAESVRVSRRGRPNWQRAAMGAFPLQRRLRGTAVVRLPPARVGDSADSTR